MNAKSVATQGFRAQIARVFVGEWAWPRTVGASGATSNDSWTAKPEEPSPVHQFIWARRRCVPPRLGRVAW